MKKSIVALLCMLVLLPTITWAAPKDSPAQALENIQSALDTGDIALFERHVDIDALVGLGVDYFLREAQKPEGRERLSPVIAMVLSSVGDSPEGQKRLHSMVGGEARNFVVYGVQSGNFAGSSRPDVPPPSGLLAPLFADASLGRKEIQNPGPVRKAGQDRIIPFTVRDYGNGNMYPVQGRMRVVDNAWRLVGLENLPTLVEQLRNESVE